MTGRVKVRILPKHVGRFSKDVHRISLLNNIGQPTGGTKWVSIYARFVW